jgi:hypothetical protein
LPLRWLNHSNTWGLPVDCMRVFAVLRVLVGCLMWVGLVGMSCASALRIACASVCATQLAMACFGPVVPTIALRSKMFHGLVNRIRAAHFCGLVNRCLLCLVADASPIHAYFNRWHASPMRVHVSRVGPLLGVVGDGSSAFACQTCAMCCMQSHRSITIGIVCLLCAAIQHACCMRQRLVGRF